MMPIAGLYAIIDPQFLPAPWTVPTYARALLSGGCPIIQLRVKGNDAATQTQRMTWARELMALKTEYNFCCIINDDAMCAQAVKADGVHIGKTDAAITVARAHVGDRAIVGYSSHTMTEAMAADQAGASYIAIGAIFPTATKGPTHPVQGCDMLRTVVQAVHRPVVAIGGITRANVGAVWATGVAAVAMITGLSHATDPVAEVAWHQNVWRQQQQYSHAV